MTKIAIVLFFTCVLSACSSTPQKGNHNYAVQSNANARHVMVYDPYYGNYIPSYYGYDPFINRYSHRYPRYYSTRSYYNKYKNKHRNKHKNKYKNKHKNKKEE